MADEPINIQVTDNIDPNVNTKLQAIATSADQGTASLNQLKAALAGIQSPDLVALKGQVDTVSTSIKNDLAATNDLTKAQQQNNTQVVSLSNAYKQLRSSADDATASIKKAQTAASTQTVINSGGLTYGAAGAARAAQPDQEAVTTAARQAAADGAAAMAALGTSAGSAAKDVGTVEEAIASAGSTGSTWFQKLKDAASGFFGTFSGAGATGVKTLTQDVEAAAPAITNLGAHSINTSTALRELMSMAREGSTGNFTRLAGSTSILAQALGILVPALLLAAGGFATLAVAKNQFNTTAEDQSLKDYSNTLGLTSQEMKKLSDTTLEADGTLKTHNDMVITYGDTWHGLIATFELAIGKYGDVKGAWDTVVADFKTGMSAIMDLIFVFIGSIQAAEEPVIDLGKSIYDAFHGNVAESHADLAAMGDDVKNYFGNAIDNAKSTKAGFDAFYAEWNKQSDDAAKVRLKNEANAIISNRTPKKPSTKKTQDDYLDDENQKLNDQLALFGQLGEARQVQQQLNEVEEAFQKRRMPLDQDQIAALQAKITEVVHLNAVQAQMNAIYAAVIGPQETYNNQMEAAQDLLDKGTISQEDFNTQVNKAADALRNATNPLAQMIDQFRDEQTQLFKYGDALDNVTNKLKVLNTLRAAGKVDGSGNFASPKDKTDADDMTAALNNQDKQKYVSQQVGAVVDPLQENQKYLDNYKTFIDQINVLEQQGVLNHNQAEQAKAGIDSKYNDIRFKGAETVLDSLSELSQSKNKELAAIGKAAAMVDATIKGYQAIQNAYAQVPYPFNIAAAAAMAVATGVQVANIASQSADVGSYWDGGSFVVRGKTGVDSNRVSMNVSDGERVTVQTQAQQAEEKRKGGAGAQPTGDTHVNNYFDEASFIAAMDSKDGDRVIMNAITRQKKTVGSVLGVTGR